MITIKMVCSLEEAWANNIDSSDITFTPWQPPSMNFDDDKQTQNDHSYSVESPSTNIDYRPTHVAQTAFPKEIPDDVRLNNEPTKTHEVSSEILYHKLGANHDVINILENLVLVTKNMEKISMRVDTFKCIILIFALIIFANCCFRVGQYYGLKK